MENKIRILFIYQCNNGYTCCCREDWEDFEIYEYDKDENIEEEIESHKERIAEWFKGQNYGRKSVLAAHVIEKTLFDETE